MSYARPKRGKPERWVREAAGNDDVEGIDAALDAAKDKDEALNKGDFVGRTALHWAAGRGRADAVRHLLALGARVKLSGNQASPLHDLAASGSPNAPALVQDLLAAAPWQLTHRDNMGHYPVDKARDVGDKSMALALDALMMTVVGKRGPTAKPRTPSSWMPSCMSAGKARGIVGSDERPLLEGAARA
jgi:hypothetical protein